MPSSLSQMQLSGQSGSSLPMPYLPQSQQSTQNAPPLPSTAHQPPPTAQQQTSAYADPTFDGSLGFSTSNSEPLPWWSAPAPSGDEQVYPPQYQFEPDELGVDFGSYDNPEPEYDYASTDHHPGDVTITPDSYQISPALSSNHFSQGTHSSYDTNFASTSATSLRSAQEPTHPTSTHFELNSNDDNEIERRLNAVAFEVCQLTLPLNHFTEMSYSRWAAHGTL